MNQVHAAFYQADLFPAAWNQLGIGLCARGMLAFELKSFNFLVYCDLLENGRVESSPLPNLQISVNSSEDRNGVGK
jgi:hypothetical protein